MFTDWEANIELTLPHAAWGLVQQGLDQDGHPVTVFARGGDGPKATITIHTEIVPAWLDVIEFSTTKRTLGEYRFDGDTCQGPRGANGEACIFIWQDGVMPLHFAIGGLYRRTIDEVQYTAYVVHAVYFDRGVAIVMQAPTKTFLEVESEFRRALGSLHAHPLD